MLAARAPSWTWMPRSSTSGPWVLHPTDLVLELTGAEMTGLVDQLRVSGHALPPRAAGIESLHQTSEGALAASKSYHFFRSNCLG
jgi:hypothetical protein